MGATLDPIMMIVKVDKTAAAATDAAALYEGARKWWSAGLAQAQRVHRVLAVADNVIVEAYEPHRWAKATEGPIAGKVAFEGEVARDRGKLVGRNVKHLFPRGAANPVRYVARSALDAPPATPKADNTEAAGLILLLRLNQTWRPDLTTEELYKATREWWVMSMATAEKVTRVLACADGEVKEAYEPLEWLPCAIEGLENRIGFVGEIADDREKYVGRDVSGLFRPGSANPVRYARPEEFWAAQPAVDQTSVVKAGREATTRRVLSAVRVETEADEPGLLELVSPLLEAFERDLIWEMSRGAQELFHSNTLAWLMSHRPETSRPVIELLGGSNYGGLNRIETWRERKSLDIVVDAGDAGPKVVVENKHYSVPYAAQLVKYLDKDLPWSKNHGPAGAADTGYVLLSLMDPAFDLPQPWRHVSYRSLGEALDKVELGDLGTDMELGYRYRALVHRLVALQEAVDPLQSLDDPFSIRPILSQLAVPRFDAPLQKMRFNGLAQAVSTAYGAPLDLDVGLAHAQGLISLFHTAEGGPTVGWQFQEDTLRLVVIVDDPELLGKGKQLATARGAWVEHNHLDWFEWSTAEDVLGDLLVPRQFELGEWNHFAPNFVYRGRKVKPETSTARLADALAAVSHDALTWRT